MPADACSVGGVRHWLWAFVTSDTTVYAICPGREFDDAATVLHQTCLNHLLQRCKQLGEDHPGSPWAGRVERLSCGPASTCGYRCNARELSEHGMATARGRLNARLGRLIRLFIFSEPHRTD